MYGIFVGLPMSPWSHACANLFNDCPNVPDRLLSAQCKVPPSTIKPDVQCNQIIQVTQINFLQAIIVFTKELGYSLGSPLRVLIRCSSISYVH